MDPLMKVNQTNLVDRPSAEMMELSMAERRAAVPGFLQKVHKWRPKIVCMVGKGIWEDVFAYIAKASKGKGDTGGIIVERCPNRAGHRGWDELKAGFEFDVQPVCLLHNLPETEGGSKDDDQCMPVGIKRTLFFVVPSTSTRVRAYQLADKITLFQLLRKRWGELEAGAMTKSVEWQIRVSDTVKLPLTYPTTDHPPWIEPPPYPRFNMNSPTKFAPRTAAPLDEHGPEVNLSLMPRRIVDKAEPAPVKFQVITREGQDIIVGRVKIPTVSGNICEYKPRLTLAVCQPNGNHAFILRRFDTGAISLSTMFRAAFPTAGDEAEKVDSNWVKTNYDLTGANGGGKLRLAGTWVPPALAVHLASSYSLAQVIYPLAEAQPDATASYRKSSRHTTNGPVNTNMGALSTPLKTTRATNPTDSPSTHPSKRTKRESASPARARIAPVSPLKQTPLSTMREESPATAPTELEQEQEPDVPGPSMEEDIAESKALIARLQREKEEAEAKAQELAQELAETASEPAAPVVVGAKRTREEATPPPTFNFDRQLVDTSDRQIVRSRAAQQANRRSAMWGAVAFAVGLGVTASPLLVYLVVVLGCVPPLLSFVSSASSSASSTGSSSSVCSGKTMIDSRCARAAYDNKR
ncbi:KilA-N domain-containing protein [Rhizoctonia solani AG-1 IA]|uniref:KilA-N domain-containing protein n=1 Tax=Thanatephorus cucumeris (strain AG1-IA) TaxID=983506 RepID=L8WVG7_THACA|nr:KilA-N domain-containing protein [Rhizoctonia solani AG-1 IA]